MISNSTLNPKLLINQLRPTPPSKDLVIIAGMPKSGTTVIAKLLSSVSGVSVCSDPFFQLDRMNVDYRDALFSGDVSIEYLWRRFRHIFAGAIVKDPNFPFFFQQLFPLFPDAGFVFIVREPANNIRSILNRLDLRGDLAQIDVNNMSVSQAWRNVLSGRSPDLPGDNYIEHLAWRWSRSAEQYLQFKDKCMCLRYEDFMENKEASIQALASQLGYTRLSPIGHLVNVQFQPRGDHSVQLDSFFGEDNLHRIKSITGPYHEVFKYA